FIYVVLFSTASLGLALLIWKAKLLVTLTQRSNVETLALAFFLVFFSYVILLSWKGALGALQIARYAVLARLSRVPRSVEARKQAQLNRGQVKNRVVALNLAICQQGDPSAPLLFPICDDHGSLGSLKIEGARMTHLDARGYGSHSLFLFFVHQLNAILRERGSSRQLDILHWKSIDDEATEQYLSLVEFARNLERQLQADPLWPAVFLTEQDCQALEKALAEICAALRDECFLPDWEYSAEHKVPVIPEPLGIASLSRSERRADPVASMGLAASIVVFVVGLLALFIAFPPWVPGV
ncbi:MAG TPA: hypothetical protein VNL15_05080, partial [Dehalococcoidia bacterium]|nr:hypothetical protein [Dehalococcoidia bacterium]